MTAVGELLHQRGWRKAFTVTEMVDQWAWLVTTVENGYDDLVDEYTNDLYCRNWLHEAWLLLDDQVILAWTPQINALDDRFRAATVVDDDQALSQFPPHQQLRPHHVVVAPLSSGPRRRPWTLAAVGRRHRLNRRQRQPSQDHPNERPDRS